MICCYREFGDTEVLLDIYSEPGYYVPEILLLDYFSMDEYFIWILLNIIKPLQRKCFLAVSVGLD